MIMIVMLFMDMIMIVMRRIFIVSDFYFGSLVIVDRGIVSMWPMFMVMRMTVMTMRMPMAVTMTMFPMSVQTSGH